MYGTSWNQVCKIYYSLWILAVFPTCLVLRHKQHASKNQAQYVKIYLKLLKSNQWYPRHTCYMSLTRPKGSKAHHYTVGAAIVTRALLQLASRKNDLQSWTIPYVEAGIYHSFNHFHRSIRCKMVSISSISRTACPTNCSHPDQGRRFKQTTSHCSECK